jgi:hypothetical protein
VRAAAEQGYLPQVYGSYYANALHTPTPEAIVNVNWPPNAHADMEARRSLEEYCSHYPNIQLAPDGAVSQVWPEWDVLEEMSGSQAPSSHPVVRESIRVPRVDAPRTGTRTAVVCCPPPVYFPGPSQFLE